MKHPIAVFVSGTGRHLENFMRLAQGGDLPVQVVLALCDRPGAGAIARAQRFGLQPLVLEPKEFAGPEAFSRAAFKAVEDAGAQTLLLAGFLRLLHIPTHWEGRVLNIHPSLLPAFGGAGFYGNRVHQAVLDRGCRVSGCTVHYVDEEYDHGRILLQRVVDVLPEDDADQLAARVFEAELEAYPTALVQHMDSLGVPES